MAKYLDSNGNVSLIENPDLNQGLIAGKTLVPDTTPLGRINSSALSAPVNYNFQQPNPVPAYPVAAITSDGMMAPTAQEQKASGLSDRLQALNEQLVGQSAFRAQQEQELGLPGLKQTQTDLTSRLVALKNEAQAIPLQLQQESVGRGITAGGLRPIETAALRNNAIQALSTASLLEASRGNIATAQDMADRAVAQRFDPIKEQIAITRANLDVILNDPRTALEDKNRALAQKATQDARAQQAATAEANQREVFSVAQMAAKYGADSATLQRIQSFDNPEEALIAAAGYLQDPMAKLEMQRIKQQIQYDAIKQAANVSPTNPTTIQSVGKLSEVVAQNKISQGTKTTVGTIMGVLNAAESMANNAIANYGGKFPGINPANTIIDWLPFRNALRQEAGTKNIADINGINLKIQQWASGAALTEQQTKQVAQMTPNKNDTDANVKIKLNKLYNFMQEQIKGSLQSEGIDYQFEQVDLFNKNKSLADIFK